jgi:hypothetical protein
MATLDPARLAEFAAAQLNVPVFYVVPDIHWALGLEDLLPRYGIVCADDTWMVAALRARGVPVFCAETDAPHGVDKRSSSGLLDLPEVHAFIAMHSGDDRPHILVFKTSPAVEKRCRDRGYKLLAPASAANRTYEDKLTFARFLDTHGIPHPETRIARMTDLTWPALTEDMGTDLVFQTARGFAGSSTAMIDSADDFAAFRQAHPANAVKVSRRIDGIPLTLDACILPAAVLFSRPFHQITGLPAFNRYAGGTCGNDYGLDYGFDADLARQTDAIVRAVADRMRADGFLGIFGLDLILDPSTRRLLVIENNARLVASVPFFSRLQRRTGQVPLALLHLLLHAGVPFDLDIAAAQAALFALPAASQLIFRNVGADAVAVRGVLPTGRYDFALRRLPDAAIDAEEAGFLLQTAPPGREVNPNMEYANMQWLNSVTASPGRLKPEIIQLAQAIRQILINP